MARDPDDRASSPLLRFCDFLEERLRTENVELLKRIIREYLRNPHEFETLQEMVQLAFPMVTIMPAHRDDTKTRHAACQLLSNMRARTTLCDPSIIIFRELHEDIKTRIVVVNWDWLLRMFDEFCVGEQHTLVEFVALQIRAISIVPVRPLQRPLSSARASEHALPSDSRIRHRALQRKCPRIKLEATASSFSTLAVFEPDGASPDTPAPIPSGSRALTVGQRLIENRETVFVELCVVESQEPWVGLYGVSEAELPAAARGYPRLLRNLSRFWRKHARAVWERNFWFRYNRDHAHEQVQHERARRQDNALQCFELSVIVPCFERLGASFFAELDARGACAPWWWYRQPIIDVVRLCDRDGLAAAVTYVRSQSRERFPQKPLGCEIHGEAHPADNRSMWSSRTKHQFMADAIDALKRHS